MLYWLRVKRWLRLPYCLSLVSWLGDHQPQPSWEPVETVLAGSGTHPEEQSRLSVSRSNLSGRWSAATEETLCVQLYNLIDGGAPSWTDSRILSDQHIEKESLLGTDLGVGKELLAE